MDRVAEAVRQADQEARKVNQEMDAKIEAKGKELAKVEADSAVAREKEDKNKKALMESKREIAQIKQVAKSSCRSFSVVLFV